MCRKHIEGSRVDPHPTAPLLGVYSPRRVLSGVFGRRQVYSVYCMYICGSAWSVPPGVLCIILTVSQLHGVGAGCPPSQRLLPKRVAEPRVLVLRVETAARSWTAPTQSCPYNNNNNIHIMILLWTFYHTCFERVVLAWAVAPSTVLFLRRGRKYAQYLCNFHH